MSERLKTHSKTQKKSADLVSNKLRIGVFQRYQMKCKSVSKKSPRYTGYILYGRHENTLVGKRLHSFSVTENARWFKGWRVFIVGMRAKRK
ncbi:hypothetical protein N3Z85_000458 [Escherichia coli]|nr:hypothetical protein [Escherichia coli]